MPIFYQQAINAHTKLGIWKIAEEEDFFLQKVPLVQQVAHPHKRLQHLAGRYLLQYLFPQFPYSEIVIAGTRRPYLPQAQFHFSISHGGNYAAAIVSNTQRVGIDIELFSPKTGLVKNKFLNGEELALVNNQWLTVIGQPAAISAQPSVTDSQLRAFDLQQATRSPQLPAAGHQLFTLLWCCKEVVYKWWGLGGVDFRNHIHIKEINDAKAAAIAHFTKQPATLVIPYILFEELCVAWTIS